MRHNKFYFEIAEELDKLFTSVPLLNKTEIYKDYVNVSKGHML